MKLIFRLKGTYQTPCLNEEAINRAIGSITEILEKSANNKHVYHYINNPFCYIHETETVELTPQEMQKVGEYFKNEGLEWEESSSVIKIHGWA